ncbi:1,2-diacylglycerol 3-alpha-glucosyltransferase [Pilibacter termitis]|uniref:1,2-diacylglycerol 3-alpha-glucosyltransferase n=1 Tax=Pilibacter termitis TaxID=263852 RepID=A0A1T4L2D7_9ENTE|nr:glycosyltransferase family 4 protein [Pilibacter termitis]SJZ48758.1 1,2-diacylglycerol 3-alpha-glucosyltransferase [Pilibacter termitis]
MKIGMFTETYLPQVNGVVTSIRTLKEELEKLGHHVYVFTTTNPNANPEDDVDIVRLPSIPFVNYEDRRIIIRGLHDATKLARELDLDLIHTHTEFGAGILGKMVAKKMKIPVVHTFHTMYEDYLIYIANGKLIKRPAVKRYCKWVLDDMDGIICPSERMRRWLKDMDLLPYMRNIPTGIHVENFLRDDITEEDIKNLRQSLGVKEEERMFLSLSRVSFEKNIQTLINGFQKIHEKLPKTKMVVVGEGPYRETLMSLAEELGLSESVVFTGEVPNENVSVYYKAADYFCSASTSESQGLTYAEAVASGTKVIAQGNAYLDELLNDDSLGVTFLGDEKFAPVALEYIEKNIPTNWEILENKLYEISAENFGQSVYEFYLDILVNYSKEIREKERISTLQKIKAKIPIPKRYEEG